MAEKDLSPQPWFIEPRTVMLMCIVVFFFFSVIASFLCYMHYQEIKERSLKEDRATARLVSLVLDEHTRMIIKTMEAYASRPLLLRAVKNKNTEKTKEHLANLMRGNPYIESLIITDREGTLWASNPERPEVMGKNFAHREWYRGISENWNPYVSDAALRVVAEKDLAVQIAIPFTDDRGEAIGILLNSMRAVEMAKVMEQIILEPGVSMSITDRKGTLIFSSRFPYKKEITPYPFYFVKDRVISAKNNSVAVIDHLFGRRQYYFSYAPVASLSWSVFIEHDSRQIALSGLSYYIQTGVIALVLFLMFVISLVYAKKRVMLSQIMNRVRTDEEVWKERDQAQMYLDIAGVMIAVLNAAGCIVLINKKGCEILGYTEQEITGKNWFEVCLPEEIREKVTGVFNKLISGDISLFDYYENPIQTKDGKRRLMAFYNAVLRDKTSQITNIIFSGEDITERKEAEVKIDKLNTDLERRVRDRTAQFEASNNELEAFSFSVSHDLRAPLRSIDGFSQALLEDYQEKLDDRGKSYLDRVRKATQRMDHLIDDMLKLSRVTRSEFKHASVDVSTIIRDITEKMQQNKPGSTVDMIIQEGIFVNGDPSLLYAALENLLDNAWKFSSKEAQPQVEFGTTVMEGGAACFIRDNGVGFDMAYVDKLFGAFQRLHPSSEFPGTGIGLATVQRIMNRHGGKVWAKAEVGKGATFYFTIPG